MVERERCLTLSGLDECDKLYQRVTCLRQLERKMAREQMRGLNLSEIAKNCHEQYPEVPDYVVGNVTDKNILLKAGDDNISGARCFYGCMVKSVQPKLVRENGEINLASLDQPQPPRLQKVKRIHFTVVKCLIVI